MIHNGGCIAKPRYGSIELRYCKTSDKSMKSAWIKSKQRVCYVCPCLGLILKKRGKDVQPNNLAAICIHLLPEKWKTGANQPFSCLNADKKRINPKGGSWSYWLPAFYLLCATKTVIVVNATVSSVQRIVCGRRARWEAFPPPQRWRFL